MSEPTQPDAWATEKARLIVEEFDQTLKTRIRRDDLLFLEALIVAALVEVKQTAEARVKEVERERDEARAGLIDKYPEACALHVWHEMRKERDGWKRDYLASRIRSNEWQQKHKESEAQCEVRQQAIETLEKKVERLKSACAQEFESVQELDGKLTAATVLLKESQAFTHKRTFLGDRIAAFLASQSVKESETPESGGCYLCGNYPHSPNCPETPEPSKDAQAIPLGKATRGEQIIRKHLGITSENWPHCYRMLAEDITAQSTALRACVEALEPMNLAKAFMACPLPESVCCDPCATIRGYRNRSGTNLLTVEEAKEMFKRIMADTLEKAKGVL